MHHHDALGAEFEQHRPRLWAVAYRMLGSSAEADDAVQETWLRLSRADADDIANIGGWLTTVTARVCLDLLRSRRSRREEPLDDAAVTRPAAASGDPEQAALMADAVGLALLVVLDTLAPAERLAFVLHDLFGVPFAEIGTIVGRSPDATRQLASRARRRVRGAALPPSDTQRQREIVAAFLAAARQGDFGALLALLDPDAVVRADPVAAQSGAEAEVRGAEAVARTFAGRARVARLATIDGAAGAVWAPGGTPRVAFVFTLRGAAITAVEIVADPARLRRLNVVLDAVPGDG